MKKSAIFISLLILSSFSFSQSDLDLKLQEVSNDLAHKLSRKNINTVAVLYITELNGEKTRAGKYIADMISFNIINNTLNFQVFDRENLEKITEVKHLINEGYFDAAKAKELGKILKVEAIIIGNYTVLSSTLKLSLKAFYVNSGLVVAASTTDLPLNEDTAEILGIDLSDYYCEIHNTGDYCFENRTQYQVEVILSSGTIQRYGRETAERFTITLEPKQTECFYSLKAIPMNFSIVAKVNHGWTSSIIFKRQGNIKIEKCETKTFVIN